MMVVIIGGGKRIGKALVSGYAKTNKVHCTFHDTAPKILGGRVKASKLDVRDVDAIRRFADSFPKKSVEKLIYVSSTFYPIQFGHTKEAEWDDLVDVNLKGAFFICEAFQSKMKKGSNIQFFADVLAERQHVDWTPYAVGKIALSGLTKILARSFAPDVRVNEIRFGYALPPDGTPAATKKKWLAEIPLHEFCDVESIIEASRFLDAQKNMTGAQIDLDGGLSLVR